MSKELTVQISKNDFLHLRRVGNQLEVEIQNLTERKKIRISKEEQEVVAKWLNS